MMVNFKLIIILNIVQLSSTKKCNINFLMSIDFDCQFVSDGSQQNLKCESVDGKHNSATEKETFSVIRIFWKELDISKQNGIFTNLLRSNFDSNSVFYNCDKAWRNFLSIDPSIFADHCTEMHNCLNLTSEFLKPSHIRRIEITNASNNFIFGIVREFPQLWEIKIYNNPFFNISIMDFSGFSSLQSLTLKSNKISFLPSITFSNLTNLEFLDLSHNKVKVITDSQFKSLRNLKFLNLSCNAIKQISYNAFKETTQMKSVNLTNNKLVSVSEKMFIYNELLTSIDLSNNDVKKIPENLIQNLHGLEDFSCAGCQLTELPRHLFRNSGNLFSADFSFNEIEHVPVDFFHSQPLIKEIYFNYNQLSGVPEIKNKTFLRIIELKQNKIKVLSENLSNEASSLVVLDLEQNRIEVLTDAHIKGFSDLEVLVLNDNKITLVQLGIAGAVNIRNLLISRNSVRTLQVKWRNLRILEIMNLDHNELTYIEPPPCIPSVKQTLTFSFQYNNISRIDMKSLLDDENRVETDRTMAGCFFNGLSKNFIDITKNSLVCDCNLYPFYKYLKFKDRVKLDSFLDEGKLICAGPKVLQNQSIISLPNDDLSCAIKKECPHPCTCGIRGKDNMVFVNCSGQGLSEIPQTIPSEAKVLYVTQNKLRTLDILNGEQWDNLTELHADENRIETLSDWRIPPNLRYLSLKSNDLESLPQFVMDFISNQSDFQLYFGGNGKNCECKSTNLKAFINLHKRFIKDAEDIVCEIANNGSTSLLPLYTVPDAILCAKQILPRYDPTITIISLCVAFSLLIALLLTYYKQRQLILSYLYIHCDELFRTCFEENDMDGDKSFDAFIAYSSSDRHIVMEILHQLEEKEPYFQLCIHDRNWLPGRFISDNIINSVQCSKRTIIVLSDSFVASPWFRLELRAAIFRVSGDRRNKLIVVLADKSTSLDGIDTEIRHVISKRTYLVWGERWFWEKLRYVMPRKSCSETGERAGAGAEVGGSKRDSDVVLMENMQ